MSDPVAPLPSGSGAGRWALLAWQERRVLKAELQALREAALSLLAVIYKQGIVPADHPAVETLRSLTQPEKEER